MKIIYKLVLAALVFGLLPSFPQLAHAYPLCSGIDLTVTVRNVDTGEVLGTFIDAGSYEAEGESYYTLNNVPYNATLSYTLTSVGTSFFSEWIAYDSGSYNYNDNHQGEIGAYTYTAPPIQTQGSFRGSRFESVCDPVSGQTNAEEATVVITINNSNADYGFTCGVNQVVTQGQNANYVLQATPDTGFTPTVSVTMASSPTGPAMNGSPVQLNAGNSYTDTAVVPTGSLSPTTYTLTFTATDGTTPHTCQASLQVLVLYPQVDLKFNNSDGPVDIADAASGLLSWQTENADTCTASTTPTVAGWGDNNPVTPLNNPYPSGVTVGPLSGPQTFIFTLQCSNAGGSDSDSVTVNVGSPPVLQPTVDLLCAGTDGSRASDGPCSLSYNTAGTLSWTSTNATACTMDPDLGIRIRTSNAGTSTGNLTGDQSYTITCTGASGSTPATDTVNFVVTANPSFDIACSPSTIMLNPGDSSSYLVEVDPIDGFSQEVTLTGSLRNEGTKSDPVLSFPTNTGTPAVDFSPEVSTAPETPGAIYTFTFTVEGGGITRSCDVELEVIEITDPDHSGPVKVQTHNDTCGVIDITWINPTGGTIPDSYAVYRKGTSKDAWDLLVDKIPYDKETVQYSTTDANPINPTGSNYYSVKSIYSDGESNYVSANPAPIVPKQCSANLTKSDKDVISVDGQIKKTFSASACNGKSDIATLPNNALFAPDDIVTFQINVCNSGSAPLTGISITDDLSKNLSEPGDYSSPQGCLNGTPSYEPKTNTVTFQLADIAAGDVTTQSCSIIFTAKVTAPAVVTAALYRFQNIANIFTNELGQYKVYTPPYLFSIAGGVPDRTETAPQ